MEQDCIVDHAPPSAADARFLSLEKTPRDPEAVYVFDFDGVISSSFDDEIYKLPTSPEETALLKELKANGKYNTSSYDPQYLRHLIYQDACLAAQIDIEAGPAQSLAQWASANALTYVVTARSGLAATARMFHHFDLYQIAPAEVYCVGRTNKRPQLELILGETGDRPLYYLEDSLRHLETALALSEPRLYPVHCPPSNFDAAELKNALLERLRAWGARSCNGHPAKEL